MKRNKAKEIIIPGIIYMIFLAASIWYSVRYNESRLIVPTDLETYQFSPKDIPMIFSIALTIMYGWYLLVYLGKTSTQQKKHVLKTKRTRKLNPKLGFLGFFGFFYEGKMSDTLMDERFKENKNRAQFMALKAAFAVVIFAFALLSVGELFMSIEYLFTLVNILIALSIALAIFLSEYPLFRYDHDEYSSDEHTDSKYVDKNEYYSENDMKES